MKNLESAKTRSERSLLNDKTKVFDFGEEKISKSFLDGIFSRFSVDFSALQHIHRVHLHKFDTIYLEDAKS